MRVKLKIFYNFVDLDYNFTILHWMYIYLLVERFPNAIRAISTKDAKSVVEALRR